MRAFDHGARQQQSLSKSRAVPSSVINVFSSCHCVDARRLMHVGSGAQATLAQESVSSYHHAANHGVSLSDCRLTEMIPQFMSRHSGCWH